MKEVTTMNELYILFDKDINDVRGAYRTFEGAMKSVNTLATMYNGAVTLNYDEDTETWYFMLNDEDPRCTAHLVVYKIRINH